MLIGFPVQAESDKASVMLDETVGMHVLVPHSGFNG
jgi:hypothetical protein